LHELGLDEIGSARQFTARCSGAERDFESRVVPTEVVDYRGGEVHAAVHDDNAFALSGLGLCGHAGLFATARAVARFGSLMVDQVTSRQAPLTQVTAERLLRRRPGGTLRAGFDGKSTERSSTGTLLGAHTFGHLGFTGTSLWCDPERRCVVVLLCNRVSPTRENPRITAARPRVHDGLLRAVGLT
jgi:CubicO group peptidase (beta-lactamase class C family)